jgi:hypothetical protein
MLYWLQTEVSLFLFSMSDKNTSHLDANHSVLFGVDDTMADILGRLSMRNINDDIAKEQGGIEEPTKNETTPPTTAESAEQDVEIAKSEHIKSPDVNDVTSDDSSDHPTEPQAYTNELEYLQ